jgi:hypothetical protein
MVVMVITVKKYTMDAASKVAAIATEHITIFLNSQNNSVEVINVENDLNFRRKDIDLIWKYNSINTSSLRQISIEIKGDNYFETGNYFFETHSNEQKNTPGCFMYSEADFLYYYFIKKELHIIPLKKTREWFIDHLNDFKERRTTTPIGMLSEHYNTVGRLVPRKLALQQIPEIRIFPYINGKISLK